MTICWVCDVSAGAHASRHRTHPYKRMQFICRQAPEIQQALCQQAFFEHLATTSLQKAPFSHSDSFFQSSTSTSTYNSRARRHHSSASVGKAAASVISSQTCSTLRSLSTSTAHRLLVIPRSDGIDFIGSLRSGKSKPNFSAKRLLSSTGSADAPRICMS